MICLRRHMLENTCDFAVCLRVYVYVDSDAAGCLGVIRHTGCPHVAFVVSLASLSACLSLCLVSSLSLVRTLPFCTHFTHTQTLFQT